VACRYQKEIKFHIRIQLNHGDSRSLGEISSLLGEWQELWPAGFTGLFLDWIVYVVHRNELPSVRGLYFLCSFSIVHPYLSLVRRGCIIFKRKIIFLNSKLYLGNSMNQEYDF
jgi:hypothetical protein